MLFRVSGLLVDNRPFSARIEAGNAMSAVATARQSMKDAGVGDEQIAEVKARSVKGKSTVRIATEPRAPRAPRKPATPAPAAAQTKPATGGKK
jgi:hypothetical protein